VVARAEEQRPAIVHPDVGSLGPSEGTDALAGSEPHAGLDLRRGIALGDDQLEGAG
jgi:hypothetical protein